MTRQLEDLLRELSALAEMLKRPGVPNDVQPGALLQRLSSGCHAEDHIDPADLAAACLKLSVQQGRMEDAARLRHRLFCGQVAALVILHCNVTQLGDPNRAIAVWETLERRLSLNLSLVLATNPSCRHP